MKFMDISSVVVMGLIIAALVVDFGNAVVDIVSYELSRPHSRSNLAPVTRSELEQYKIIQACNLAEKEEQLAADVRSGK